MYFQARQLLVQFLAKQKNRIVDALDTPRDLKRFVSANKASKDILILRIISTEALKMKQLLSCSDILFVLSALSKSGKTFNREIFANFKDKMVFDSPHMSVTDLSQLLYYYVESVDAMDVSFVKDLLGAAKNSDPSKGAFLDWKRLLTVITKSGISDRDIIKHCCEGLATQVESISSRDAVDVLECLLALNVNHNGLVSAINLKAAKMTGDSTVLKSLLFKFTR